MKTLVVVLALLVASSAAFAAETQTATITVYNSFSWVGAPIVPITASYPNTPLIFGPAGVDIEWTGSITRLDAPTGNLVDYWAWDPAQQWSVLLGEGYVIDMRADTGGGYPKTVTFTGIKDGVPDLLGNQTDMWISLPGNQIDGVNEGGWHFIATPFNHAIPFNIDPYDGANIKVTDGNTVRTLLDAATVDPVWIEEPWTYLQSNGNQGNAGYLSGVYDSDQMEPGLMYIVKTRVDNLALIIPAKVPGS